MRTITPVPGDGIGREIVTSVKSVFSAAQIPVTWEEYNAGADTLKSTGELISKVLPDSIERNKVALKGPIGTLIGTGFRSANVTLCKIFDLYSNLCPVKTITGIPGRFDNVHITLFRENTEELYAGLELYDEKLQIADAVKRDTRTGSIRISWYCTDIAGQNKANPTGILKSAILMLEYLINMKDKATLPENALHQVLLDPNKLLKI